MDPERLQALSRRFWYPWAAGLVVGAAVVIGGVWLLTPENGWLAAVNWLMALLVAGLGVVAAATGDRVEAVSQTVIGVGFVTVGVATVSGFPDTLFWGGWAVAAAGAAVGFVGNFRGRRGDAAEG